METDLIEPILRKRKQIPADQSLLVGISGIDASGKGFVTAKTAEKLKGLNAAVVNVDGWLNLPHVRFDRERPAENFYENALRLDEMFESLVLPLKQKRSVNMPMDYAEETATEFRRHNYPFNDIDIILLEGIFIFEQKYIDHFDLKIWIDCTFDTALRRAISRGQEGLAREETIRAYETIYFPAQRLHFERDNPKASADIILDNY